VSASDCNSDQQTENSDTAAETGNSYISGSATNGVGKFVIFDHEELDQSAAN